MPDMRVAIHQPNFFPWPGYFDKMRRADLFVFLDDAQFPKTGGTWSNRVAIAVAGQAKWMTAPVERGYAGVRGIDAMHFTGGDWRGACIRKLGAAYRAAPFYDEAMALLTPLILHEDSNIARYNMHAIEALCERFGLDGKRMRSSSMGVDLPATERLIAIVRQVGGSTYLCGGGAAGYQDDDAFAKAGIRLEYQSYRQPPYPQSGQAAFTPGLSVIDLLMQRGVAAAGHYLRGEAS